MHLSCADGSSAEWGDDTDGAADVDERGLCGAARGWALVAALAFNVLIGLGLATNR